MTRVLPNTSLLDAGRLPIAELARIAMREGVRPRAAYQAHKWFARRLAITARSLLVAAASQPGDNFWRNFYKGDSLAGCTVLDPFVGGGVMLLEAARLGANIRGVDIEPVAVAIAKFQTLLHVLPKLDETLDALIETVGARMAPFYEAEDSEGRKETLLHAFWVQRLNCRTCGHTIDAHPTFRFAWDEEKKLQWVACRSCSHVIQAKSTREKVTCPCGTSTRVASGHVHKGELCCPACGSREKLIEIGRRMKRPPAFHLFAVETLPHGDARRCRMPSRRIRTATPFDQDRYCATKRELAKLLKAHPRALPASAIPKGRRSDSRLLDYGYTDYRELFNARQRLHLALLGSAISRLKEPMYDAFAMAFSDHLTTNNMMCGYAGGWRRLTPIFSIRAYRHISRPVEINPWLRHNGRGTFPNAVRAVTRAADALKYPLEPTPRGLLRPVKDAQRGRRTITCGDARHLGSMRSESIDLVLTDPPYFDYISYSELGHFFAPWMSRFGLISAGQAKRFPRGQIASNARSAEAEKVFAKNLCAAFKEIRRVCRADGRVVFTYQNLSGRGWHAIAAALADSGIIPMTTFPLYGDSSASLHKRKHSISWDCVMVCRPGEAIPEFVIGAVAKRMARQKASEWQQTLRAKKLSLTKGDAANIAYAASIVAEFALRGAGDCFWQSQHQTRSKPFKRQSRRHRACHAS